MVFSETPSDLCTVAIKYIKVPIMGVLSVLIILADFFADAIGQPRVFPIYLDKISHVSAEYVMVGVFVCGCAFLFKRIEKKIEI